MTDSTQDSLAEARRLIESLLQGLRQSKTHDYMEVLGNRSLQERAEKWLEENPVKYRDATVTCDRPFIPDRVAAQETARETRALMEVHNVRAALQCPPDRDLAKWAGDILATSRELSRQLKAYSDQHTVSEARVTCSKP